MTMNDKIVEALYQGAFYSYDFDVNEGIIEKDILGSNGHNYTEDLGLKSPCEFDEIIRKSMNPDYLGGIQPVGTTFENINCKMLLDEYAAGKRMVEICVYVTALNLYHKIKYFLVWDEEKEHVHAYVLCKRISQFEREHIIASELYQDEMEEVNKIASGAGIGIWNIWLIEGKKPRLKANKKMCELMGISEENMTAEELFDYWFSRIKENSLPSVLASVEEMKEKGTSENTYLWNHPTNGEIWVRCGGTSEKIEHGVVLSGYHMDVTETINEETKKKQMLEEALAENVKQEEKLRERINLISSMANMYFCSYYLDLEKGTFVEIENKIPQIHAVVGKQGMIQVGFDIASMHAPKPEYLEQFREFTDITTIQDRLKDTSYISFEFEGAHVGWVEGAMIAGDRDETGNCKHVIWCLRDIREQKTKEELLFANSYMDQLTGLYNRRMYEDNIIEYGANPSEANLVYISMDVNGLKNANDTLGHDAGDELLKGAARCMKQCLEPYGRVFRTGGDEFAATIFATREQMQKIEKDFKDTVDSWRGEKVDHISVSFGYVTRVEYPDLSVTELSKIADRRMYNDKQQYYNKNGVDRREQQNAFRALCSLYTKILKVNLTNETFQLISMEEQERTKDKGYSENIYEWLANFGHSGQVHPEDLDAYLEKTKKEYLTAYFDSEKVTMSVNYRRKINDVYHEVIMEMVPADDYSEDNQTVYLYVKNVDRYAQ